MTASIDGVVARLEWAEEQAGFFNQEVGRFPTKPYFTLMTIECENREHSYRIYDLETVTPEWAFRFGAILHDLRATLDNLAYQFALRFQEPLPEKIERGIMFPISTTETSFKSAQWHLRDIDKAAFDFIRDEQPYRKWSAAPENDPLAWLEILNILDKHRRLLLFTSAIQTHKMMIPTGNLIKHQGQFGKIENGMEYTRLFFREAQLELYADIKPGIAVGVERWQLSEVLTKVPARVREVIQGAML